MESIFDLSTTDNSDNSSQDEEESRHEDEKEEEATGENENLGILISNLGIILMAISSLFAQLLMISQPTLSAYLLYAMRQSLLLVCYIMFVNKKLKHYVYDNTDKSNLKNLVIRSLFGTATLIAGLILLK